MMENRNIPDPEKSWMGAERMLDDHFRRKKIIFWSLAMLITALITGLTLFILNSENSADKSVVSSKESTVTTSNNLISQAEALKNQRIASGSVLSSDNLTASTSDDLTVGSNTTNTNSTITNSTNTNSTYSANKLKERERSGSSLKSGIIPAAGLSLSTNNSFQSTVPDQNSSLEGAQEINRNSETQNQSEQKIKYTSPLYASLEINVNDFSAREKTWPQLQFTKKSTPIGWEATFYGGAQYVQKSLSTTNDWDNYLQHRKNEEDPIVTPAIGLSVTANKNSWGLSLGVEYTYYGEKTNYYPYSNQQSIVESSGWQTYQTYYVDTDTAYITGNQFFLETNMQRQDSAYVTSSDTVEEYKYDQFIADKNGVNKIYYVEMPIEISYCINRGRTGFGISGGIAPAILTQTKGYYLRPDGKGIESLDEIKSFRKFMVNGRISFDFYYRAGARTKLVLRPQLRANLNSVFEDSYGVKQKYYSTGVLFGVSYLLN
jgi:hypothetical protein